MKKEARNQLSKSSGIRRRIRVKTEPKTRKWDGEVVYVFKYVCVDCSLNPDVYDESDRLKALEILKGLTKEIWIDKTYVDFKGTRFEKTFLAEEGWNALKNLVFDTDFGARCTKSQRELMDKTYRAIIPSYLKMVFSDIGWDTGGMSFEVVEGIPFQVEYHKDTAEEWRSYPGRWQDWGGD